MTFVLLNGELKLITEILVQVLHVCGNLMSTLRQNRLKRNFELWMESLVSEKWSDTRGRMLGVVVGEFHKGGQMLPVILLIVDEDLKVLLKDLVYSFHLPIGFRTICHGEVGLDAKKLTQGPPETGDEMFPTVRDDVGRCPMLGEDVHWKEHSKILGINILMGCNE